MIDHGDKPKPGDVKDIMSGLATGFEALAHARDQIGAGSSSPLEKPIEDNFGRFVERKDFVEGCNIGDEITRNGRVVCFTTTDSDVIRDVEIGKTPLEYDPTKGGKP